MTSSAQPTQIDGASLLSWARRCVVVLEQRREEINALNVFPVPDADTGSNMAATMAAALAAAERAVDSDDAHGIAAALAAGAVGGARGNSGVVLSQVLRALAEAAAPGGFGGEHVQKALDTAVRHVDRAIADPVEGTILTVLRQAAVAAGRHDPSDLVGIVAAASAAARKALDRTPSQLPALREAGVVDAGGAGLVLLLDALLDEVSGETSEEPDLHVRPSVPEGPELELMFLLDIPDARMDEFRSTLQALGNSLVVAGEGGTRHMVHVHTADAGAVIDATLDFGRPENLRIEVLVETLPTTQAAPVRSLLAVAPTGPISELFASAGATPVGPDGDVVSAILGAIAALPGDGEVLLLPNGLVGNRELIQVELAAQAGDHSITILPTSTLANGLAAVAVHDGTLPLAVDAYAMSEAAAGMRTATLTSAPGAGLTAAGPCAKGDVLAMVGGDILVVADTVDEALSRTAELMLRSGGELVTVLLGTGVDPESTTALRTRLEHAAPGVDVTAYAADGIAELAQIGVE
ncbi:DAK2 domain-containing protein [uncultured Corynebacterium sp.]|uniref:DAK2 domain-containing protein n=1 Tax=uncultured Corynebacterium sp. TaxID=159447 RepID=UPI0026001E7D|nr:DAK2 domain-containing protein [uncultured Corynebacterium sp.]